MTSDAVSTKHKPPPHLGMELFEIKPVIFGGDPVDPQNKTWLTRQQHFEAVRYWNRLIRDLRESQRVRRTQ